MPDDPTSTRRTVSVTPLAVSTLGILTEGPRHPYDLYRVMIDRREDLLVKVKPGTLYHAIAKLEQGSLVRSVGTERDGNRPERTTYEITDAGREALRDSVYERLSTVRAEYPSFPLAVAWSHVLDDESVRRALSARLVHQTERRDGHRAAYDRLTDPAVTENPVDPRQLADLTYVAAVTDAEIAWLKDTLAALDVDAATAPRSTR